MWCYQTLCVFHLIRYSHTCIHTGRQSDTPYVLHICVRNGPEIKHDLFIALRVKSNQLWTKAGKKGGLRLGSDPHLIGNVTVTALPQCSERAFAGIKIFCLCMNAEVIKIWG